MPQRSRNHRNRGNRKNHQIPSPGPGPVPDFNTLSLEDFMMTPTNVVINLSDIKHLSTTIRGTAEKLFFSNQVQVQVHYCEQARINMFPLGDCFFYSIDSWGFADLTENNKKIYCVLKAIQAMVNEMVRTIYLQKEEESQSDESKSFLESKVAHDLMRYDKSSRSRRPLASNANLVEALQLFIQNSGFSDEELGHCTPEAYWWFLKAFFLKAGNV